MTNLRPHGFTLLETIIVIVILGIIAGIGTLMLTGASRSYFLGKKIIVASEKGNMALQRIERESRGARLASIIMTPNTLQFQSARGDTLQYRLQGNQIERKENSNPWQVLLKNVSNLNFSSFNSNGASYITVNLALNRAGGNYTLTSSIFPRNSA